MPEAKRRKMASPIRCIKSEVNENLEFVGQHVDATGKRSVENRNGKGTSTPSSDRLSPDAEAPEPPQKVYTKMAHYESAQAQKLLLHMRNDASYSDIQLKASNDEIITAHKAILVASSSYFTKKLKENPDITILELSDCPASAVRDLIDYLYTSRLNITQDGARDLLSVAVRLELASAQHAVEMFLRMRMTTPIAIQTLRKQKSSSSTKLLDVARTFAINNFTEVVQDTNFYQIPLEELESIVQQSTLNIKSEEDVFTAVIKWIKADEVRKKSTLTLYRLLQHVRLPLAKPQFLLDVVQIEPLIKQNSECERLLDEARRYHLLADQRPLLQSPRTQPRKIAKRRRVKDVIVLIGGLNRDKQQMTDCFYFRPPQTMIPNGQENFLCRPEKLESPRIQQTTYSVAKVNNLAVLTGGLAQAATDEVHAFIPSLDLWQQMAPMSHARFLHSSASMDGYLYVAGGMVNTKTRLSSVERWCPDTNQWEEIKDLPRALSSSCLCACDGKLYLVGGACEGSQTVSSVYSYDPADNEWTECKPLPEPERGVAAVALSGNIYVIGKAGRVYAYSTSAEEWRRLRETNGGHLHGAATVFKGRIYVAGGLHGNDFINRTVEVYEPLTDSWSNVAILPTPVYAHGLITLTRET